MVTRSTAEIAALASVVAAVPAELTAVSLHAGSYALMSYRKDTLPALFRMPNRPLQRFGASYAELIAQGVVTASHLWLKVEVRVPMIAPGHPVPLGGLGPVYAADTVAMCEDGRVTQIVKSSTGEFTTCEAPERLHRFDFPFTQVSPLARD